MSSSPASSRSCAATFPEWEPPRSRFGAPIITAIPASRQACAASSVVGNSAKRQPCSAETATCAASVSSWLAITAP